jgi:hypothetical protein
MVWAMVAARSIGSWIRDAQRQGLHNAIRGQNKRVFDQRPCTSEVVGILHRFDSGMFCKCGNTRMARLVILDHIDGCFECLLMDGRRKRWRLIKTDENADIKELFVVDTELLNEGTF